MIIAIGIIISLILVFITQWCKTKIAQKYIEVFIKYMNKKDMKKED